MLDDTKLHMGKRAIQSERQTNNFNEAKYKKLIDMVSDITLHLTLRNYRLLNFGVVLKMNFYNYIKRPLKYSFHFPLHICVRLHFEKCFNQNYILQQSKNISRYESLNAFI